MSHEEVKLALGCMPSKRAEVYFNSPTFDSDIDEIESYVKERLKDESVARRFKTMIKVLKGEIPDMAIELSLPFTDEYQYLTETIEKTYLKHRVNKQKKRQAYFHPLPRSLWREMKNIRDFMTAIHEDGAKPMDFVLYMGLRDVELKELYAAVNRIKMFRSLPVRYSDALVRDLKIIGIVEPKDFVKELMEYLEEYPEGFLTTILDQCDWKENEEHSRKLVEMMRKDDHFILLNDLRILQYVIEMKGIKL